MCGIAGVYNIKTVAGLSMDEAVMWGALSARGTDASGCMWCGSESRGIAHYKQNTPSAYGAAAIIGKIRGPVRWLGLHARHATVGKATDNNNNHPVQHGPIYVTHNGVVHNDSEVFRKLGVKRRAEVDTAAIAACLSVGGLPKLLQLVRGSMAIAWASSEEPETLHLYTNGPPVCLYQTRERLVYASEEAVVPYGLQKGAVVKHLTAGAHLIIGTAGVREETVGIGTTLTTEAWYLCYDISCKYLLEMSAHLHTIPYYTWDLHAAHSKGDK